MGSSRRTRAAWIGVAGALAACTLRARDARAGEGASVPSEHPPVRIVIDACLRVSQPLVQRRVARELHVPAAEATTSDDTVTRVHVRCEGNTAVVHLDDPVSHRSIERVVQWETVEARARAWTLSLAVSELIATSWTELATEGTAEPAVESPQHTTAPAPAVRSVVHEDRGRPAPGSAATDVERRYDVGLSLGGRGFLRSGFTLLSTSAWGTIQLTGPLRVHVGLAGERGSVVSSEAAVRVNSVSLSVALLLSGAIERVTFRGGAGLRGAVVGMRGSTMNAHLEGTSATGFWGGPCILGAVHWQVTPVFVFGSVVEAGWTMFGLEGIQATNLGGGEGAVLVSLTGPWLGINGFIALTL